MLKKISVFFVENSIFFELRSYTRTRIISHEIEGKHQINELSFLKKVRKFWSFHTMGTLYVTLKKWSHRTEILWYKMANFFGFLLLS